MGFSILCDFIPASHDPSRLWSGSKPQQTRYAGSPWNRLGEKKSWLWKLKSGNHSARQDSDETVSNCHSFLENRTGYTNKKHAFNLQTFWIQPPQGGGFPKAPWHTTSPTPADSASWDSVPPPGGMEGAPAHWHRCHVTGSLSLFFPCKQHFSGRLWTTMRLTKMWCLTLLPQQTGFVQR